MRSSSGITSLQSRYTSGLQASCCAGVPSAASAAEAVKQSVSEMASVARGNRDLPRAFVLPLLARTSCVVQLNGRQLVLEYGIYRLRG